MTLFKESFIIESLGKEEEKDKWNGEGDGFGLDKGRDKSNGKVFLFLAKK